jgi:succinyl-CoA synthetase beta subunit
MIASAEGGVEIEEVAKKSPEKVIKEPLHPLLGLQGYQARELAFKLGVKDKMANQAAKSMMDLSKSFVKTDASLVEINPLTAGGEQDREQVLPHARVRIASGANWLDATGLSHRSHLHRTEQLTADVPSGA